MIRFRVATYNTHKSRGMDWRVRPDRIVQVLREIDADVVALQEVVGDQAPYLAEQLRIPHVFGPAGRFRGHDYGNLVLTRLPLAGSENHDVSVLGREPRACLQVDVRPQDGPLLHVFAVHLGTSWFERRRQALLLASPEVLDNPQLRGRRILLGDFNEWTRGLSTRLLSERLESADLRLHARRRTSYPGITPFLHLDHIYHDPELRLTAMRLHRTRAALVASDHLPLVGDFEVG